MKRSRNPMARRGMLPPGVVSLPKRRMRTGRKACQEWRLWGRTLIRGGNRFAVENAMTQENLEHVPIPTEPNML
jgi:hypothetical protein